MSYASPNKHDLLEQIEDFLSHRLSSEDLGLNLSRRDSHIHPYERIVQKAISIKDSIKSTGDDYLDSNGFTNDLNDISNCLLSWSVRKSIKRDQSNHAENLFKSLRRRTITTL